MIKRPTVKGKKSVKVKLHRLNWLEWVAVGFSFWFLVYPHPYDWLFGIVLAMPIIGLLLNGLSRPNLASLVSISFKDNEEEADLADFIDMPAWVLLARVLIDFEYESFYSILKVGSIAFVLSMILLFITHKMVDSKNTHMGLIYFTVIGNMALYSYGAAYGINCVYDYSDAEVYHAKVIDKHISSGKHKWYYLKVEAWGTHRDAEDISVTRDQYKETQIGQLVAIDYKEGLLGIPWYFIE